MGVFPPQTNTRLFLGLRGTERNGEELNIKKLYEKFRGSDSHGIVCSQFSAALFLFFNGGGEEETDNSYLSFIKI